MGDVATEIDLQAIPARLRRLTAYAAIFALASVGWWFLLPVLRASVVWSVVESFAIWAPITAAAIAVALELARSNRTFAFRVAEYVIGICLLASLTHFILSALQFGEVQSITKCCGYSRLISASQNPLGYWMYLSLLCALAFGAAAWGCVRYAVRRTDER